jgi:delta11-fatty-acid desaturase
MLLVAMTQINGFAKGHWFAIFTMPLAVWIFSVNVFHDASHFALSKNWKINDFGTDFGFMFSTPYVWYH